MSSHFIAAVFAFTLLLGGCAHLPEQGWTAQAERSTSEEITTRATYLAGWGDTIVHPAGYEQGPSIDRDERNGPYTLDTGDVLRIFVYGEPNLSRLYPVDSEGRIAVPLIGAVRARGRTTQSLARSITGRLGAKYVRDPKVTVDIQQSRPFFILGEVRSAGQFPFSGGITIESAVAIAGGYTERANESRMRVTRRVNGMAEVYEVTSDFHIRPGDTIYVTERMF